MTTATRTSKWSWLFLGFGFVFLYAPMLSLIVYSFNENRLVTVWSGFSTKWYGALMQDDQMLGAAWVSLQIAFYTACASVVLGTMAAMVMTRMRAFRGKTLFSGMITAPLVMPEVITGLSLLLLFVSLSTWTGLDFARGMTTIWVAHVTLCMAFVTVVISSRLAELDRSLEEAAMDLGATPVTTFMKITLPVILPAVVSGWMLAFTLSLDDLVIASFTSGPGATTLPMKIYSQVRLGVTPEINAVCTIMIAVIAVGVIATSVINKQREVQRVKDEQAALRG